MEVQKKKKYNKGFREDVVNMVKTGNRKVSEIAKELDIPDGTIYRWYKSSNRFSVKEGEKLSDKEKELRLLRIELAEVMEERDILKKALNIFSKQGIPR